MPENKEIYDGLCPYQKHVSGFLKAIDTANIMMTSGEDKTVWLESEEYGLFRPDFLQAFMKMKGGAAT